MTVAPTTRSQAILLTEMYPPAIGGSAVLLYEVYRRVEKAQVVVVTDPRPESDCLFPGPVRRLHRVSTPEWGLLSRSGGRHHLRLARMLRTVAGNCRSLIHCARAMPEGVGAWLASQARGPGYVCWAHGEDLITARSSREFEWLTSRVLRRAVFAIANSRNTAQLISSFGVQSDRIRIVYPGVDAERFTPAASGEGVRRRLGIAPDEMVILSVGRFQRRKGHDLAIRAVTQLRTELPMVRYVIVGGGEDETYLRKIVAECGAGHFVHLVGEVTSDDLPSFYAASDLFLLPNRVERGDIEGFGIVFLEAASSGLPVVAGRSGGVPEAVSDGVTGILVSGTDVDEIVAAMRAVMTDAGLRRALGEAGRQRVLREFTWNRAALAVEALHLEGIARNHRRRDGTADKQLTGV